MAQELLKHLQFLYGDATGATVYSRLKASISRYRETKGDVVVKPASYFDERDVVLITYGDMVQEAGEAPLHTLAKFLEQTAGGIINTVHLLPFYPYSSDDGFSVIDYRMVDVNLGEWEDVARIGRSFRLMFDAVVNHISADSEWFKGFLRDESPYKDYFIIVEPGIDLAQVFRPRTLPVTTKVETVAGDRLVWTTFSSDQIDLNYANPKLLLDVIDIMLFYVAQGARLIRLDAIAFIWKEIGTNCIHRPETHHIIQLMRLALNEVDPTVVLITETNVPHHDNISYFGNGHNEAQMVYNFSLPPLTLHAFHNGNAEILSQWATTLTQPSNETTFFNFLASHDGIGLTPARGLLSDEDIADIATRVEALGGHVSYRTNPDGSKIAYELNINYLEALGDPARREENVDLIARRFIGSQAIMLALRGVPGIYLHSLFGSKNWYEGVQQTGRNRSINREKMQRSRLERELADEGSLRQRVFNDYSRLLEVRRGEPAFHPNGSQTVLDLHPSIFAIRRSYANEGSSVLCLHNVSCHNVWLSIPRSELRTRRMTELLAQSDHPYLAGLTLDLEPYQVLWLKEER
jgi:sucrose phosphorylase